MNQMYRSIEGAEKKYSPKRRLRILTAFVLTAALLAQTFFFPQISEAASVSYPDVAGTQYESAVAVLTEKGVLNGYQDGTFRPENDISRAEVAKVFSALLAQMDTKIILSETVDLSGLVSSDGMQASGDKKDIETFSEELTKNLKDEDRMKDYAEAMYTDLGSHVWAQPHIARASFCGIVNGYGSKIFKPSGNITYNELAAMCVRAAGIDESELTGSWPENYIAAATELGVYKGMNDFDPETGDGGAKANRGNTAVAVSNVLAAVEKQSVKGYILPNQLISVVFTQNTVSLSYEKALEIMKTEGTQAQMAELSRDSDEALAEGYRENARDIYDALLYIDLLPPEQREQMEEAGVTDSNLELVEMMRDFIKANIDNNYQADMNKIEQTTSQLYFGLMQAQKNVEMCKESLAYERKMLEITELKYSLGSASALEVKAQLNSVTGAEDALIQAENTVNSTQSSFLMLLGMDTGYALNLTTQPSKTSQYLPAIADAQSRMLKNNLELKYYDHLVKVTEHQFDFAGNSNDVTSAEYLKAKAAYEQAKMGLEQMTLNKKNSLRTSYQEIEALESQIAKYESLADISEDSLILTEKRYELGMATAAEVQSAQLTLTQTKMGLMNAVITYNQAVENIWYEIGVGTTRVTFS